MHFYHGCCLVSDVIHVSVSELPSLYNVCTNNVVLILDCGVCRKAEIQMGGGTPKKYNAEVKLHEILLCGFSDKVERCWAAYDELCAANE